MVSASTVVGPFSDCASAPALNTNAAASVAGRNHMERAGKMIVGVEFLMIHADDEQ
jgi:hypothetical protein